MRSGILAALEREIRALETQLSRGVDRENDLLDDLYDAERRMGTLSARLESALAGESAVLERYAGLNELAVGVYAGSEREAARLTRQLRTATDRIAELEGS